MKLGKLASSIAESPTLRLNALAKSMLAEGIPVIHLGGGEPKNKAPRSAIDAACAYLSTGDVKYTPSAGTASLRKAAAEYTERNYGRQATADNILISAGAKQTLYNLLFALTDPGDEVIIPAPYWVSYPEMVRMAGGVPVIVPSSPQTHIPRAEDLFGAVTARTKAILYNSPNNPSGALYPAGLVEELVRFCEREGIWLVADDIYHKLVFDGKVAPNPCAYTDRGAEDSRLILLNAVSKIYGMTGFRIGWAAAPRAVVAVMNNIQAATTSCNSGVLMAAAEGALKGPQEGVAELVSLLESNRDAMLAALAEIPGVRIAKPQGTFYCLPDFSAYGKDSTALSSFLLEQAFVVTVPGKEFGAENHLRLSYCGSRADVLEGIARIRWALDPASPMEIRIGEKTAVRDW
ncbi:MAG: pyridoxal phosphate-dependent aminotransferase [Anaerolineales bacterium]|nr:pyridoxal phosphate-dependent aminotransferase [Anaerolineales bacterium]